MHFFMNFFKQRQPSATSRAECLTPIGRRLAEEFALLQELEFERIVRANPTFGRGAEERIVWRELIDLELQELDEQIAQRAAL